MSSATAVAGDDDDYVNPSAHHNSSNSQNSMLATKVARALEVRSDTPAMKAALDALAHLPDHQDDLFSVDSRSVRVAIEQDALQQALLLQKELQGLLETVGKLRQGVAETAAIAQRVEEAIHTNVVTASVYPGRDESKSSTNEGADAADDSSKTLTPLPTGAPVDQALEEEQRLAALLSDAFAQRNAARKRVEAVDAFLEKFDLSEEDSRLLDYYAFDDVEHSSSSTVNGMAFLAALERVRNIRKELGRTFGTLDMLQSSSSMRRERSSSSAGGSNSSDINRMGASSALRMMEVLAQKQERAYERLYHWLQKYLNVYGHENPSAGLGGGFTDEDHIDEALAHPFVRRSLYTLRNVPAFYSHLLELISGSRRAEETRRFLLALTSGYGGLPPIEMRAHDSVVYVGDMLAFCFRSFSVEADVARGLLDYVPEESDEPQETGEEEKEDVPLAEEEPDYAIEKPITAAEMLSQSMGGVSRPLKARILQVISSLARRQEEDDESDDGMNDGLEEEGAAARSQLSQLYEICGLLLFYASAMGKTMSKLDNGGDNSTANMSSTENNPLLAAMMDCLGEAVSAFEASLRVYAAMLEQLNVLTGDSEASLAHAMITRIVEVRKASPGFTDDMPCPPDHRHTLSLDWACDALIEAALPACKSLDDTVTLRQSISIARQTELGDDVAVALEGKIHYRETALIDVFVEKETTDVLDLCGLGSLISSWERFKGVQVEGMVMANHPGLSAEDVASAMSEFYSSLYSPPLPSFESTIKDPTLRKLARSKIAKSVCNIYESLYNDMERPDKGGYDDLSFLGHTPQQVNTLFTA